jgi:hypothetical protein
MLRTAKIIGLGIVALAVWGERPAMAACEVVSATHSAPTKGEALVMSRALAAKSAQTVGTKKGWARSRMSAHKVKPDPFWKKVRPVVPQSAIYGTFLTPKTYSIFWTGVRVPYVCTSGAKVCGN